MKPKQFAVTYTAEQTMLRESPDPENKLQLREAD